LVTIAPIVFDLLLGKIYRYTGIHTNKQTNRMTEPAATPSLPRMGLGHRLKLERSQSIAYA